MTTFTSDYTITTLSGNLNQYNAAPSPIIPAGRIRQFSPACPYTVVNGDSPTFPFGCTTAPVLACSCVKTKVLSGSSKNGSTSHLDLGTSLNYKNNTTDSPDGWTMAFWVNMGVAGSDTIGIYTRGWSDSLGSSDASHLISISGLNAKPSWNMRLGGDTSNGMVKGNYNEWNLGVFQLSQSGGTLTPRITVVSSSAANGHFTSDYSVTAYSDTPVGVNSYLGAWNGSSGLKTSFGGVINTKIADFAIWNKTLSLEEITGTLWNDGRPLCLDTSDLSTDLDHWWRMGDGTGDVAGNGGTIADQVGSVDGTIVSGSLDIVGLVSGSDSIYCNYS